MGNALHRKGVLMKGILMDEHDGGGLCLEKRLFAGAAKYGELR